MKLLAPVFLLVLTAGCNPASPTGQAKKPVEVVVTTPIRHAVADYQDFTGRLDGLKTVEVRTRVSGFILEAPFKEGDPVYEGALLFQVDPRPYQAALNQAEANLRLAVADRDLQEKNARRARVMIAGNSIGREEYDTIIATYEKARATVGAMEAARDLAKLNLGYARVTAPLSGRISRRQVDPGNLITADNTLLTTIVSDHQLYAYFDVDERTYLDLVRPAGSPGARGQAPLQTSLEFPVVMSLANEGNTYDHVGKVNFIDNRVNATSGTIRMRGVFENQDRTLKAGLFVRIRLPLGKPYQTLLVSAEALQSDQGRTFVYVVNDQNEVAYRRLTVGQELHGLRVVKEGLAEGDRVIVGGIQRVRPGAPVEVKVQPPPEPPDTPLLRLLTANPPGGSAGKAAKQAGSPGEKGKGTKEPVPARTSG